MCIHFLYCVYMVLNNQQNSVCQFKSNPSNKKKKKLQTWLLDIQRQFYDNVIFIVVNICLGWGSQYLQKKHVRDFTSKSFPFTISYINAVYCGFLSTLFLYTSISLDSLHYRCLPVIYYCFQDFIVFISDCLSLTLELRAWWAH